ncbi:hypothetical protein V496_03692 [Pseudogymnoascus sp. VKM F-4515 (FW-2607)]|nr:hypothetical protein V496_03692 [Pseudogymnoascus sp. VKM F-4515 (FW-2607)]
MGLTGPSWTKWTTPSTGIDMFTEAHTDCQDTTRTTTEQGLAQTALLHRPAPPFALSSQLYRLYRTIEDSMSNSLPTIPLEVGNWSVVCCTL